MVGHYIFISHLNFFLYEMLNVLWHHPSMVQILQVICLCSRNISLLLVGIYCSIFFYSVTFFTFSMVSCETNNFNIELLFYFVFIAFCVRLRNLFLPQGCETIVSYIMSYC